MNARHFGITFCVIAFSFTLSSQAIADTVFSRADGTWSNTLGGPNCGCTPQPDDIITVNHNITIFGSFTLNTGTLVVASGVTLSIGTTSARANLTFNNQSEVIINGSLYVTGNFENKNNSDDVDFNGYVRVDGDFKNNNNGVIDFGTGGSISIGGTCQNPGQVTGPGYTGTGCTAGPLPVKLIFFRAEQSGTEVQLTWATASEKNFEYFAIERADEQLNWEEVGRVDGSGNSLTQKDYAYTDAFPGMIGNIYYRLKAVDFDGYTEYFRVATVIYRAARNWYVSPNPAQGGEIVLMRNFAEDESIMATLYSMSGAEIFSEQITIVANRYVFPANVKPGLYVLKVKENNTTRHLRVAVE